jgi:hypothetical protein
MGMPPAPEVMYQHTPKRPPLRQRAKQSELPEVTDVASVAILHGAILGHERVPRRPHHSGMVPVGMR